MASMEYSMSESRQDEVLIAQFTNGRLNVGKKLQSSTKFGYYGSTNNESVRHKNKRVLVAETGSMQYVGYNHGTKSSPSNYMSKFMVGILNKDTGKMQVCDAQYFIMRPQIEDEEDDAKDTRELSFVEKSDKLTKAFSSTRRQRAVQSRLRNKLSKEELEKDVGTAVQSVQLQPQTPQPNNEDSADGLFVPYDKNATRPEEVYKLNDLISATHIQMLKEPCQQLIEVSEEQLEEWRSKSRYPVYILNHLRVLPSQKEHQEQKAACLLYLHYLFTLFHLKVRDLHREIPFPADIPDDIKISLLKTFTVTSIAPSTNKPLRLRPPRLRDKLLSYIILISLHIDEFELHLNQLHSDLKIGLQKILSHVRNIGCKITTKKSLRGSEEGIQRIATLPLPLKLPDKPKMKRKK
ncbi:DNA-directed RNA polymerase I subunit RPA49-like [Glandiceps talaboti]